MRLQLHPSNLVLFSRNATLLIIRNIGWRIGFAPNRLFSCSVAHFVCCFSFVSRLCVNCVCCFLVLLTVFCWSRFGSIWPMHNKFISCMLHTPIAISVAVEQQISISDWGFWFSQAPASEQHPASIFAIDCVARNADNKNWCSLVFAPEWMHELRNSIDRLFRLCRANFFYSCIGTISCSLFD